MAANTRNAAVIAAVAVMLGCASEPLHRPDHIRHYQCDDGMSFSVDVQPAAARLYTATGVIELPRERGSGAPTYTNGLRTLVVDDDGLRHALGRRAWARCSTQ